MRDLKLFMLRIFQLGLENQDFNERVEALDASNIQLGLENQDFNERVEAIDASNILVHGRVLSLSPQEFAWS